MPALWKTQVNLKAFLLALCAAMSLLRAAPADASPLARPAWLQLEDVGFNYAALQYNGLPRVVTAGGVVWIGAGCRGPDKLEPAQWWNPGGAGVPDFADDAMLWLAPDATVPSTAHLRRSRCYQKGIEEVATLEGFFSEPQAATNFSQAAALPGHQVCALVGWDVKCLDPTQPTPKSWILFSPKMLAAALLPDDKWKKDFPAVPAQAKELLWDFRSILPTPGGSVFAIIDHVLHAPGSQTNYTISWVIERRPDAKIVVRLGPSYYDNSTVKNEWPKLVDAQQLLYDAQSGSVMVYPLNTRLPGGTPGGLGMALLPVKDAGGLGLLDLQQAIMEQSGTGKHELAQGPDGQVYAALPYGDHHAKLLKISLAAGARDLDRDGLPEAAEAAAGTSDLRWDSDGGGSSDAMEVLVDHTNPMAATDDWGARTSEHVNWSYSQLIQLRIPLEQPAFQWQQTPYACGKGKCYAATGKLVVDVSSTFHGLPGDVPANMPAVSGDGMILVWDDGEQVRRRWLGGTEDVLISSSDLVKLLDLPSPGHEQFIVNKQGRVYVPGQENVAVLGDGPPRILWNKKTAECEALMGACAPPGAPNVAPKLTAEKFESFAIVGYDADTDRLIAAIRTTLDGYLMSFGVGAQPLVVKQGLSFPKVLVESPVTKDFNYIAALYPKLLLRTSDSGWLSIWEAGLTQFLNSGFVYSGEFQFGAWPGGFSAGWDTSLFVRSPVENLSGLIEVPRLDFKARKGDVWLYSVAPGLPTGLMISGPRGGVLQLTTPDVAVPTAMGASADGQLCVVMPDGALGWSSVPDKNGIPTKTFGVGGGHDATDCLFDDKNQLYYLATNPPRIGVMHGDVVEEWPLPGVVAPKRFTRSNTDGLFRIVDTASPGIVCYDTATQKAVRGKFTAAGMTVTRGGWLVALTAPDGHLVRVDDAQACSDAPEELARPYEKEDVGSELIAANLDERPDGLILMQRSVWKYTNAKGQIYPVLEAFDPRINRSANLTPQKIGPAFALIPGGEWCDAWEPMVAHDPARCWTMPPPGKRASATGDAAGGAAGTAADSAASASSGCDAGSRATGAAGPGLAVLLVLLVLARFRQRAPSCSVHSE